MGRGVGKQMIKVNNGKKHMFCSHPSPCMMRAHATASADRYEDSDREKNRAR